MGNGSKGTDMTRLPNPTATARYLRDSSRSGRRLRSRSALCEVLSAPWSRSPSKPRAADTAPALAPVSLYMVGVCVNRIGTDFWTNCAAIIRPFTWGRLQCAGQGDVMQPGRADLAPSLRPPVLCLFRPDRRLLLTCSGPVKSPVPRPLQPAIGGLQSLQHHDIAGFPGSARRPRGEKRPASRRPDCRRRAGTR